MAFKDRAEAGRKLGAALAKYKSESPVVLALPRGGVAVAVEVASALSAPLDLVLVRKIGAPFQPELAMGAIVDGPEPITVRNEDVIASCAISQEDFEDVRKRELEEIKRRRARYLADRPHLDLKGCTAIVVDDGIATGATMRAALRAVRTRGPKAVVLAVPVAPSETLARLKTDADEVVCLQQPPFFAAIGAHYDDFRQLTDQDVVSALARFPPPATASAPTAGGEP